jgi:hypothetical protein
VLFCRLYDLRFWRRCLGYLLAVIAGFLKFFPMVLLLMAFRESLPRAFVVMTMGFGGFSAIYYVYRNQYAMIMSNIPRCGYFCDQYWIGNVFFRLLGVDRFGSAGLPIHIGVTTLFLACTAALAVFIYKNGVRAKMTDRGVTFFIAGSLLLLTSFILESNTYYRAMHLLLTLPFLMRIGIDSTSPGFERKFARILLASVFCLLWIRPIMGAILVVEGLVVQDAYPAALSGAVFLFRDVVWLFVMAGIGALTMVLMRDVVKRRTALNWE